MVDAALLNKGKVEGQAIGAGVTQSLLGQGVGTPAVPDYRIWCGGDSTLVVEVDMTGAAVGDLAVTVIPYEADQVTPMTLSPIPPIQSPTTNPSFGGGHVYFYGLYDVSSIECFRVDVKNNNVGAQTITRASWRLS